MIRPGPRLSFLTSRMRRILPLCLLASCGIFGLSSEEAQQLASYQQNAATYWENGDLGQAIDQAQRGLEIAPDDYKLLTIWGYSLLRLSGNDEARLQGAKRHFERLMGMRSMSQHNPQALLGYGSCLYMVSEILETEHMEELAIAFAEQRIDKVIEIITVITEQSENILTETIDRLLRAG